MSISIFAEGMWAVVMALQVIALDQRSGVAVAGRDVPWRRPGRVRPDRWHRRRPHRPAQDHHRRRDRERDRGDERRGAEFGWRAADLAHGRGGRRRWASRPRSSSPPTARSCRGSCPPNSCWPPTASRASCGRCSSRASARRSRASWWARRSLRWAPPRWPRCSPSAWCCWSPPARRPRPRHRGRTASGRTCCAISRRLRLHGADAVAVVDAAVREHLRAGGARPDRGAAAVHRAGPLRRRAQAYGFILAFFGIGSAIGALAVSSRRLPRRYLTVMMAMWSLGSLPLVLVGVTSSFP